MNNKCPWCGRSRQHAEVGIIGSGAIDETPEMRYVFDRLAAFELRAQQRRKGGLE